MNEIPYNIAQEFTRKKDKNFSCPKKFKRNILLAEEFFELEITLKGIFDFPGNIYGQRGRGGGL